MASSPTAIKRQPSFSVSKEPSKRQRIGTPPFDSFDSVHDTSDLPTSPQEEKIRDSFTEKPGHLTTDPASHILSVSPQEIAKPTKSRAKGQKPIKPRILTNDVPHPIT